MQRRFHTGNGGCGGMVSILLIGVIVAGTAIWYFV